MESGIEGVLQGRIGGFLRVSRGTGEAGCDRGRGFWGCSRNKCREHRAARQESPCRAREGVKLGLWGFLGSASRVRARRRSKGLLVALTGNRLFARSL